MDANEKGIGPGFSIEAHPETFVFWPSLAVMRSIGVCEDPNCECGGEPQAFGWCITLSFLVWSVYYSWEDRG